MVELSQHRPATRPTAVRRTVPVATPRGVAHPAARTAASPNTAGPRGFVVLLVAGLAVSGWALFPSAVESGVYIALPELAPPAADAAPTGPNLASAPFDGARESTVGFLKTAVLASNPATFASPYSVAAIGADVVPVRSKLQMLLLLLHARYGDDLDATALGLKLQDLLRLPDSLLAQLMQHPDLVDLNRVLDNAFSAPTDLSGLKTELDKIEVTSTEQVAVVKVSGKPAYVVHAADVSPVTENIIAQPMFAALSPTAQLMVVSALVAPPDVTAAVAVAPTEEPVPATPEPAARVAAEPEPPAVVQETTTATGGPVIAAVTAAPTVVPTATPPEAQTAATTTSADVMTTGNKFEPGQTLGPEQHTASTSAPESSTPATGTATPVQTAEPTDATDPAPTGGVPTGGGSTPDAGGDG